MLLTCPQCRSGLQVPDGTTAKVRCPACKTIFSPNEGQSPETVEEKPRAKPRSKADREDEEPRKKKGAKEGSKESKKKDENRDFDPIDEDEEEERKRKKKSRRSEEDELTLEEKAERRAAFMRAAYGAKCIWVSLVLFMLSMVLILLFHFLEVFSTRFTLLIVVSGFLSLLNWILAGVGVGLCLSGPRAPGHWGYGIAAALAVAIHLMFLFAVFALGTDFSAGYDPDDPFITRWGVLPTRLDATMFYLTSICYHEQQGVTPPGTFALSMVTGVLEMVRTMFILMLLSCLSRAALDEELAHKCTRAAGIAAGAPGLLALIILLVFATLIETNAGLNLFTRILLLSVQMGVYSIIVGTIFPSFMTARDVDDAMEEPYQSLIPQL